MTLPIQPERQRFWKIAPGSNAKFWDDCRKGGFICIGWDELGDLNQYSTEADVEAAYKNFKEWAQGKNSKAPEIWDFRNLQRGDQILANDGITSILGIGEVIGPYEFSPQRERFKHCVPVRWSFVDIDLDRARKAHKEINDLVNEGPDRWAWRTVKELTPEQFQMLTSIPHAQESKQELQRALKSVLDLQEKWSAENTKPMQERGDLIRNGIPAFLKTLSRQYVMEVEGRDGTGRKTRVPWVRIYDRRFSPSATEGWYVVYLFAADGSAVFISLNQGTTKFLNGSLVPIEPELLRARVEDARLKLNVPSVDVTNFLQTIDLRDTGDLGRGYESGNAYPRPLCGIRMHDRETENFESGCGKLDVHVGIGFDRAGLRCRP